MWLSAGLKSLYTTCIPHTYHAPISWPPVMVAAACNVPSAVLVPFWKAVPQAEASWRQELFLCGAYRSGAAISRCVRVCRKRCYERVEDVGQERNNGQSLGMGIWEVDSKA